MNDARVTSSSWSSNFVVEQRFGRSNHLHSRSQSSHFPTERIDLDGDQFAITMTPTIDSCKRDDVVEEKKGQQQSQLVPAVVAKGGVLPSSLSSSSSSSAQERNDVLEDIHGVYKFPKEDPSYSTKCIQSTRQELLKIQNRAVGCSAYNKANFLAPTRVSKCNNFILMFLRAKWFNPKLAAKSIIKHFQWKQQLFGIEKLTKDITLDDLDVNDIHALQQSGSMYLLPKRDATGRLVVVCSMSSQLNSNSSLTVSTTNQVRFWDFSLMTLTCKYCILNEVKLYY